MPEAGSALSNEFLQAAYEGLGYEEGELYRTDQDRGDLSSEEAVEYADWLQHAWKAGADAVFFVDKNPVVVFASSESDSPSELREQFNSVWCLARPALLFLATPGALSVYSLSEPPVRRSEDWKDLDALEVVQHVAEVPNDLLDFHAEEVATGKLFRSREGLSAPTKRADQVLIRNLETVRESLIDMDLNAKYAHAIIGRSIFIRYLEDRGVLTEAYFRQVAQEHPEREAILDEPLEKPLVREGKELFYPDVLRSKEFSYALFEKLTEDFNGDMFPSDEQEKEAVEPEHLERLRNLLLGDSGPQGELFFWAYEFDIIPVDLISSIYEQFYHDSEKGSSDKGAHYTPGALVEFSLSKVLSVERLRNDPRVIDPACGSGIFIVEAFRRIVRFRTHKAGRKLRAQTLRAILRDQIAGIEVNFAAAQIAAFSLYLAFLDYQEPSDILNQIEKGERLPKFVCRFSEESKLKEGPEDETRYDIILNADSFNDGLLKGNPELQDRFGKRSADVVVGNPPWGDIPVKQASRRPRQTVSEWLRRRDDLPIGNKEYAQAFVWRARELLREGGQAALLLPTGVFFKHQKQSRRFRREWLRTTSLQEVVNFAHTRRVFFAKAISPFAAVVFANEEPDFKRDTVQYWSAKKTAQIEDLQAVVLSRTDLNVVPQRDLAGDDDLWKVYWWGSHRDANLISSLKSYPRLDSFSKLSAQGFKKANQSKESAWLSKLPYLDVRKFESYGPLREEDLDEDGVPERVEHHGREELYQGLRLLVRRGKSKGNRIDARLAEQPFCFRHSIQAFKLEEPAPPWKYKAILGVLWSSLAQYFLFLTSSNWGIWHEEVYLGELRRLPVALPPEESEAARRVTEVVDHLRGFPCGSRDAIAGARGDGAPSTGSENAGGTRSMFGSGKREGEKRKLEERLDEAVFELYGLREPDRDLIRDMRETGFELLYEPSGENSATDSLRIAGSARGTLNSLGEPSSGQEAKDARTAREGGLAPYLRVFLKLWNQRLRPKAELAWRVVAPRSSPRPFLAVIFEIIPRGERHSAEKNGPPAGGDDSALSEHARWRDVLSGLEETLDHQLGSRQLWVNGLLRVATDTEIVIVKRNERRLWTRSAAYEDVEATELQVRPSPA